MEQTGKGVISPTDLMSKLAKAKKLMNMVDGGNFPKNNVNEGRARYDDDNDDFDMDNTPIYDQTAHLSENININQQTLDINKINQSRLPENIKRAMIEKPITQPDISLSDGLDMNIIKGAKRIMEQENPGSRKKPLNEQTRQQPQANTNDLIKALTPIIENVIRKVMDEKLTQLLTAQKTQSINENLVLKVGDSIFKGKITGVQNSK